MINIKIVISRAAFEELERALPPDERFCKGAADHLLFVSLNTYTILEIGYYEHKTRADEPSAKSD